MNEDQITRVHALHLAKQDCWIVVPVVAFFKFFAKVENEEPVCVYIYIYMHVCAFADTEDENLPACMYLCAYIYIYILLYTYIVLFPITTCLMN